MIFQATKIPGAFIIDLEKHGDHRGFFARSWCREEFDQHGLNGDFVQCNSGWSKDKGTLRGLHYQVPPAPEEKLVRCIKGKIFDVMVDLRPESETYMQWMGTHLSSDEHKMIYVPERCAHAFLALEDDTEILYPVTGAYAPEYERGLRWDDPAIGIDWPDVGEIILSEKDRNWPDYEPE